MQNTLNFPAMVNARDLGGYPTVEGKVTRFGAYVRADSSSRLTPVGVQAVIEYGVRTVIDLRFIEEKEQYPSAFEHVNHETHYINHSMLGKSWQHFVERGATFDDSYWYGSFLDLAQPQIGHVLRLVADAPPGGVLYHCAVGKDRTGVLSMLLLTHAGVAMDIVAQDYAQSAIHLRDVCLEEVNATDDPAQKARIIEGFSCRAEYALGTINHLNRKYGSIASYFHTVGLSDDQVARLHDRLV